MVTRVRVLQTCVLVLALCTACVQTLSPTAAPTAVSPVAPVPVQATVPSGDAPTLVVRDGTQGMIADTVSIGAGNFWEDDYVDEAGQARHGLTVGLWITVRGEQLAQEMIRAHVGQTIRAGAYTLLVVEIQPHRGAQSGMPGGSNAFVRIAYVAEGTRAP
jgi:hypothetical protein